MKYLVLLSCAIVIIGCNNNDDQSAAPAEDSVTSETTVTVQRDTGAIDTPACYALQTSNNLVLLRLTEATQKVSGQLTYDIMGKDKNDGIISGNMRGDTLVGYYSFTSEGKRSVRQIAFLRKGDTFVEGFADVQPKGDTMLFSTRDSLSFDNAMVLAKIPCPPAPQR